MVKTDPLTFGIHRTSCHVITAGHIEAEWWSGRACHGEQILLHIRCLASHGTSTLEGPSYSIPLERPLIF